MKGKRQTATKAQVRALIHNTMDEYTDKVTNACERVAKELSMSTASIQKVYIGDCRLSWAAYRLAGIVLLDEDPGRK